MKITNSHILIILASMLFLWVLSTRYYEGRDHEAEIKGYEDKERKYNILVDSLVLVYAIKDENLNKSKIKIDSLTIINKKDSIKLVYYKQRLKDVEQVNYYEHSDSAIYRILSGIIFTTKGN